tara:strand:+ start:13737 stop:14108 length:372 start_codon:yes stop_codon:yes gene_type:complete
MENNITLSLDISTIDNIHKETKVSKKLLTIGNRINNLIADINWINEVRQDIKFNREEILHLQDKLIWEKDIRKMSGLKDKDIPEVELELEILDLRNQNESNRNHIKEMKEVIKRRKQELKDLL